MAVMKTFKVDDYAGIILYKRLVNAVIHAPQEEGLTVVI
jgi:hypothetical protein